MEFLADLALLVFCIAMYFAVQFLWTEAWYPSIRNIILEVMAKEAEEVHDGVSIWDAAGGRLSYFTFMNRYLARMDSDGLIARVFEKGSVGVARNHSAGWPTYHLTEKGREVAKMFAKPTPQ